MRPASNTSLPRLAINAKELAEMAGVSEPTVRKWTRDFGLPISRIGGNIVILISDFEDWVRRQREQPRQVTRGRIEQIVRGVRDGS